MAEKKTKQEQQIDALRRVRKSVPPPSRAKEDEKKYRRGTQRRVVRDEVERDTGEA
ncbi:MAG: hypothetical protein HYZ50_13000 [Deltaproteobacteria bacterium]|nr:hypothetical protein [Deltaproteobacteria bacterium]